MKIASIVGTRPNFVKISSLVREIEKNNVDHILIHTGQHYDKELSESFFEELGVPKPDINLNVGSGSYGEQVGNMIIKLEKALADEKPDLVVVVGDVNSTLAGALTAKQTGIKVAHVEAGLRSFDFTMPEEINRMLTDRISDYLFTTEESGNKNLIKEGIDKNKIFFVGNVMIDTLLEHREKSNQSKIMEKLGLNEEEYCVLTLHRPSNVDNKENFGNIIDIIDNIQNKIKVVFPIHPRSREKIRAFNLSQRIKSLKNLMPVDPLGYLDFLSLMSHSKFVLTDSGGIQEETTILGVPCITLRKNTERPVTVEKGTNLLVSTNKEKAIEKVNQIIDNKIILSNKKPELWDGKSAQRIVKILLEKNSP